MVLQQARKTLKNKDFSVFEDILKELYKLRKLQSKKCKEAKDRGDNIYFSKKFPDKLYVNGQFIPHHEKLWTLTYLFSSFALCFQKQVYANCFFSSWVHQEHMCASHWVGFSLQGLHCDEGAPNVMQEWYSQEA